MKPGTWIVKVVMWAFFLGAIAYFGVYAWHVLFSGYETASLYSYSAEDTVEATGYMVRQEEVLPGSEDLLEISVAEGETVAAGDELAEVYDNEEALERHQEIKALESRLESLQYILTHSMDDSDNATLNSNIIDSVVNIRAVTASQDLTNLPDETAQLKTLMFRRDYTYNGSSALTEEIADVVSQAESLSTENRVYTTIITAPASGTFSGMVDGYEEALTPEDIKDLTPSKLEDMLEKKKDVQENENLGKLITNATWYFAAELEEADAARMKIGDTATLRFNSLARTIDMTVESVSKPDDGIACVVFSSDRYLSETTLLRDQTVDIIFDTIEGYRVDKAAVHVDNESGDIGVYRVYGAQMDWISVEILWEDEDYYLIRQVPEHDEDGNLVEESELDLARQLRSGTEIVVQGRDLYDGKVIK